MIRHVLAAVDVSETGTEVLRRASAIAQQKAARLTILNVVEHVDAKLRRDLTRQISTRDEILADARSQLENLVMQHGGDVSSESLRIEAGAPHDCILSIADEIRTDLIALGDNRRQSVRDKVLGGTADRVVRGAQMPVLVVKRRFEGQYRTVVAAIDLEAGSDHVAEAARAICSDGQVRLVHVVDLPLPFEQAMLRSGWGAAELSRHRATLKSAAHKRLEATARRALGPTSARTEVIVGETAPSLVRLSRRRPATSW
ncbi:MAG: universal stress protein [Alphaproteobacteria bacterium]|jgi:nucleotide-binding universal stress UspA family protein|nr:universal stress protein [Alphaproteobacteria bacterium]